MQINILKQLTQADEQSDLFLDKKELYFPVDNLLDFKVYLEASLRVIHERLSSKGGLSGGATIKSDFYASLVLKEALLLVIPYAEFDYQFECEYSYDAVEFNKVPYTAYETRGSDNNKYQVPVTKYRTVEDIRTINGNHRGNGLVTCKAIDLEFQNQSIVRNIDDYLSKEFEKTNLIHSGIGYPKKIIEKILGGQKFDLPSYMFNKVIDSSELWVKKGTKNAKIKMINSVKLHDARGQSNRNYVVNEQMQGGNRRKDYYSPFLTFAYQSSYGEIIAAINLIDSKVIILQRPEYQDLRLKLNYFKYPFLGALAGLVFSGFGSASSAPGVLWIYFLLTMIYWIIAPMFTKNELKGDSDLTLKSQLEFFKNNSFQQIFNNNDLMKSYVDKKNGKDSSLQIGVDKMITFGNKKLSLHKLIGLISFFMMLAIGFSS